MPKDSKHKLPDPKIWKWCKHPECLEKARQWKGVGSKNEQQLMREYNVLCAVFYGDYCWEHLSEKVRGEYKEKIEDWVYRGGRSLKGANLGWVELREAHLSWAQLQGAYLDDAKLQGAYLGDAKLQEAHLSRANLQGAYLWKANLQGAYLGDAKLQGAHLDAAKLQEAYLANAQFQGAILVEANFQNANLAGADMRYVYLQSAELTGANLHGAELEGAFLKNTGLRNAMNLHFNQIKKVGEEDRKEWEDARIAYKGLKEYFSREGLWKDAATAYYREKLMEFKHSWASGKILKGIWLLIFRGLAGFGEHPWKTVIGAIGTILFFSFVYWLGADFFLLNLPSWIPSGYAFLKYLYFSVVTFATLGFGDIFPQSPQAAILVIVEVLLGYFFLGLIVTLIARKVGR